MGLIPATESTMKNLPLIYINTHGCEGSHQGGWTQDLEGSGHLPPVAKLVAACDPRAFQSDRAAILLEDGLLHPLRVQLDEKVPARELSQFLLWRLKRFLPYPIDQVELRYLALREPGSYLTFSLPRTWVAELFEAFQQRGVHCGYIGGLFVTLLENRPALKDRMVLCLFRGIYLLAELDEQGGYSRFQTRRLPFRMGPEGEELDIETLIQADLAPLLKGQPAMTLFNFEPGLASPFRALTEALGQHSGQVTAAPLAGPVLQRFTDCLQGRGVPA